MAQQHRPEIEVMERGHIYFAYRPKVEERAAKGMGDVQRSYMILEPEGKKKRFRVIVLGHKKMPSASEGSGQKYWGFVDKIGKRAKDLEEELMGTQYLTRTRGKRPMPPARPAGEGVYELVRHGDHTHLAYALELPAKPGEVQKALNIEAEASYIVSVKNPEKPLQRGPGLSEEKRAHFPQPLQEKFHDRSFIDAEPALLDCEGAEIMLIGAGEPPQRGLGLKLDPQKETAQTAEIFKALRLEKSKNPPKPLFEGPWA